MRVRTDGKKERIMSAQSPGERESNEWEREIRALEEKARAAFLAADIATMGQLTTENYVVNSPLQKVVPKKLLLELLQTGRIRHSEFETHIEHISRHGDVVVVMGNDRVVDPPDGAVSLRRYTNVWQCTGGVWRSIARHAHVVSRTMP